MKYILLALLLLIIYFIIENKFVLSVRHEKLGSGLRIVHVSDLHKRRFGNHNSWLCRKVKREKPDIIFITGDLVSRDCTDLTEAEKVIRELSEVAPVYMIFGNHEQDLSPELQNKMRDIAGRNGAELLENRIAVKQIKGKSISICGIKESYDVYKVNGGYYGLKVLEKEDITALIGERPDGAVMLLAHNPFFGEAYSEWGADFTFSGHVHGGIIRIFGKPLLSPERTMFPKASKGVYTYGRGKLFVSAGLGKPRLFNPPEIVVYDLNIM